MLIARRTAVAAAPTPTPICGTCARPAAVGAATSLPPPRQIVAPSPRQCSPMAAAAMPRPQQQTQQRRRQQRTACVPQDGAARGFAGMARSISAAASCDGRHGLATATTTKRAVHARRRVGLSCAQRNGVSVAGRGRGRSGASGCAAAAAAADSPVTPEAIALKETMEQASGSVAAILSYSLNFARVAETYEVHTWMVLLGVLKHEDCHAAKLLTRMGLQDLYGAWHEVLWALHASNGLNPRAHSGEVRFSNRCLRIMLGAANFAAWGGRSKVQSEDVLMALAAGGVLSGLFPDLGLTFEEVRKACAKAGISYNLPEESGDAKAAVERAAQDDVL